MLSGRYEPLIAWRYLHRRRQGRATRVIMLVFALASLFALGAALGLHGTAQTIGAGASVPCLLLFVFFLLLQLFSGFTAVSIVGVAIGVLALLVVLSVTSGFQQSFEQKVLGANAHVDILKWGFSEYRDVEKRALAEPHVVAAAPFILHDAMVAAGHAMSGVEVKGIDPKLSPRVLDLGATMRAGRVADLAQRLPARDDGPPLPGILVGWELAKKLKVGVGDRARLVIPKADFDPSSWSAGGGPETHEFRVAGIFYTGFEDYDARLTCIELGEAQKLFTGDDSVTGVELKLDDPDRAPAVVAKLGADLGAPYKVIGWEELNHNLFAALSMQKVAITVVLTLIIVVAAFNIIAAMTMLVIGKAKEIAILKSMGMRSAGVARIFQTAGLVMGLVGTTCGLALGLVTIAVLRRYDYRLDPHIYLIDKLPVKLRPDELVLTVCITLAICLVATLYPALKAARLPPVEGLRYE